MDMRAATSLKLHLLGGFQIRTSDGGDLAPPGRKLRALIACLALPPGVVWPRERLIALLWSDRDEDHALGFSCISQPAMDKWAWPQRPVLWLRRLEMRCDPICHCSDMLEASHISMRLTLSICSTAYARLDC